VAKKKALPETAPLTLISRPQKRTALASWIDYLEGGYIEGKCEGNSVKQVESV
jgi:hypothetical protein